MRREEGIPLSSRLCGQKKHEREGETPSRRVCVDTNTPRRVPPLVASVWTEKNTNEEGYPSRRVCVETDKPRGETPSRRVCVETDKPRRGTPLSLRLCGQKKHEREGGNPFSSRLCGYKHAEKGFPPSHRVCVMPTRRGGYDLPFSCHVTSVSKEKKTKKKNSGRTFAPTSFASLVPFTPKKNGEGRPSPFRRCRFRCRRGWWLW